MPVAPPGLAWFSTIGNVAQQGAAFEGPLSPSNNYYAFLSKLDFDETTELYDVYFEMVAMEWLDNAVLGAPVVIAAPPPLYPDLAYSINGIGGPALAGVLGVADADAIAEGSAFLMQVLPAIIVQGDPDAVLGNLYDPAIDAIQWQA